jgi:hypothetical protein
MLLRVRRLLVYMHTRTSLRGETSPFERLLASVGGSIGMHSIPLISDTAGTSFAFAEIGVRHRKFLRNPDWRLLKRATTASWLCNGILQY